MMRFINVLVVIGLVVAAAYVYKIKFEATVQAERVAKLHSEIRRERDAIATLRAEWAKLENPARIQGLAKRHLPLKPVEAVQFDTLDHLPERPPQFGQPGDDPIGAMLGAAEEATGSIHAPTEAR